jgi:hypothetical protein
MVHFGSKFWLKKWLNIFRFGDANIRQNLGTYKKTGKNLAYTSNFLLHY